MALQARPFACVLLIDKPLQKLQLKFILESGKDGEGIQSELHNVQAAMAPFLSSVHEKHPVPLDISARLRDEEMSYATNDGVFACGVAGIPDGFHDHTYLWLLDSFASFGRLVCFDINECGWSGLNEGLMDALDDIPTLKEVRVVLGHCVASPFLTYITLPRVRSGVETLRLPQLERLDLAIGTEEAWSSAITMIKLRYRNPLEGKVAPLKRLHIEGSCDTTVVTKVREILGDDVVVLEPRFLFN